MYEGERICIIALILFLVLAFCTLLGAAELRRRICSDDAGCNKFMKPYARNLLFMHCGLCGVQEPVTTVAMHSKLIPT
jgi:hypothetical protein